ncbi:hypothetical protein VTJ83DRAFT_3937 [Remersonia thermophila]|uniref:RCC1-like domain-containing protein n=1 Tax=Remersonia thermophila TaxID=72144 RepID=A0ABR4DGW1_9PEZI
MAPRRPAPAKRMRDTDSTHDAATKRPKKAASVSKALVPLSRRPTQRLNVYVVGANSGGELGLGPDVKSGTVGRSRLNPYLSGSVGVVQVSLGAMHGVALTADNQILTWGVNDHGALGRDTSWEGSFVDIDAADSHDDDGARLNPHECVPLPVDMSLAPADTEFTQVAATDNATFVLTSTGRVYGWGAFKSEDGNLSFSPAVSVQSRPALIAPIKNVAKICCGSNHVVALAADHSVYTWGRGTEGQLGRRHSPRVASLLKDGLIPQKAAGLKDIVEIGTGANHSFAIDRAGRVYSWGFNNAGQTGVISLPEKPIEPDGFDVAIPLPRLVEGLSDLPRIKHITGGDFHSLAVTIDGHVFAWGRLCSFATGHRVSGLPPTSVTFDSRGKPSSLVVPTILRDLPPVSGVSAASEHSLAVTADGEVYTWGLNLTKQIGQRSEEVRDPTMLVHRAIADRRIVWVGAGAQFSMFGEAVDSG